MVNTSTFRNKVILSEEQKQQGFWVLDDVHFVGALSPLFASFEAPAVTEGTLKAFETLKLPIRQFSVRIDQGRYYQEIVPHPESIEKRLAEHKETVQPLLPILKKRLFDYVDSELMPFYQKLDVYRNESLSLIEAKNRVLELYDFYIRAWELHFEIVLPRMSISMALEELYQALTQSNETSVVYEMLTGVMNKTLESDQKLWKLADLAKSSAYLQEILLHTSPDEMQSELEATEEGQAYFAQLLDYLKEFGYRSGNSHEFMDETLIENPAKTLEVIASYMQKDYNFDHEFNQLVQRREAKTAQILTSMPDGELKQIFTQIHAWALESWGLDEDHHFYIDAMLPAKSRLFLLNVGTLLVEHQVISKSEDVFHLYLDELLNILDDPSSQAALVQERKAEHERNQLRQAPPFFGTPPEMTEPDPIVDRIFGLKRPDVNQEEQSFKGYAASKGTYTGVVKVIKGKEDFAKLQSGDVLVCRTTTPPWTVLFSVAGAIVTDAGGILSHAATVAREYQLPSVVGSKVATSLLKDGDIVTVDGTNGVVYFGGK